MKGPRFRIQVAALTFIMLPAVAGIVAVRASATCERFVRTYVTKPVRNRVSKTTAEAWELWRIGHPNWKPNPNLHRPKYLMNRQEAIQKIEFACSVPLIDIHPEEDVAADVPPIVNFLPLEATQIQFPNEIPPEVAEITPEDTFPALSPFVPPILAGNPTLINGVPIYPPSGPIVPGETPEPSTLLLAVTGLPLLGLILAGRMRALKRQAA